MPCMHALYATVVSLLITWSNLTGSALVSLAMPLDQLQIEEASVKLEV